MNLGVIVGRFQVPELHDGHKKLIEKVKADHGQVLIFLGCPRDVLGSKRNPLDFATRERMLRESFPDILILPLHDQPTDELWSQDLDAYVKGICPIGKVQLYGGRDSFIPHYKGRHKTVEIELEFAPTGTDVRYVTANRIRVSADFRAGVIYATANQYARVFVTVDVAIIRDGKIALGKKKNQDLYCFPGGFVDADDGSFERAAHREGFEETGLAGTTYQYICSMQAADWRYRHKDDGVIMTSLYACFDSTGELKAGDDLQECKWFELANVRGLDVIKTHRPLLFVLQEKLLGPKGTKQWIT